LNIFSAKSTATEANKLENIFLYNVDDLQAVADGYLKLRQEEVARCETIIKQRVRALIAARRPSDFTSSAKPAFGA
jgi:glutamyl-tRNA reductase